MTPRPRHATALETVSVTIPAEALEAYEAALAQVCGTVGFFLDDDTGLWTVEGVKDQGEGEAELAAALALAALATGHEADARAPRDRGGGLARPHPCRLPGTTDRPPLRRARHASGGTARARRGSR